MTTADTGPKPSGLTCPRCLIRLRTWRTVNRPDGSVRRDRRCVKCPYRATTTERVTAEKAAVSPAAPPAQ